MLTKTITSLLLFFALAFTVSAQNRYGGSYAKGIELFNTGNYNGAINEFKKAEAENPENYDAYLWHGLAIMASGRDLQHANDAATLYNSKLGSANDKTSALAKYLLGLGHWHVGYNNLAETWFGLAAMSNSIASQAQASLKAMKNNEDAPSIKTWATLAGLAETKTLNAAAQTDSSPAATKKETAGSNNSYSADNQTNAVTEDADGTLSADRPILKCPVEQKLVRNGTPPDLKVLEKVFRCQSGEKLAAKGMDGAFIIDVESMQVGTPRRMDYLKDKGDGTPNVTIVYPIKVTWTEKTFYRTRTAVVEKKIAIVNFNVNSFGEWQYGSAASISNGTYKSIPGNQ